MPVALDASVTLSWCFPDENSHHGDAVLEAVRSHGAFVPPIWHYEVRNILVIGVNRGRIEGDDLFVFLDDLMNLPIETKPSCFETCINLARKHNLSVYDAAYLELALTKSLKLESLDKALVKAYHQEIAA